MKKLLSVLLCIMLLLTCCFAFAGCSTKKAEASLYTEDLVDEFKGKGDIYTIKLKEKHRVDTMILEENTDNVKSFGVYGKEDDGTYTLLYRQNRIDKYRVCSLDEFVTDELRIEIFDKQGKVKINNIEVYDSDAAQRTTPLRVTEYLLSTGNKLANNRNNREFYDYFKIIDDIILFGDISMDMQGNVVYNEGAEDFATDIEVINEFKAKETVKNPDLKIVASVDIKSYTVAADYKNKNKGVQKWIKKNIKTIVPNLVAFAQTYNIDGLEIAWDYPESGTQWSYFSKLIVELDKQLDPLGKYVTVSLRPDSCKLSKKARNAVEYVNLTTYDMYDERGEHTSNYETCKHSIQTFMSKSKFKADKIMLGLSLYGRTTNQSSEIFDLSGHFKDNKEIDKWVNKIYNYKYYDDAGVEKYSDIYFNGYAMVRDKTTYAIATGLGGVSIFRMAYDVSARWEYSLHNAVAEAIARGITLPEA